MNESYTKMYHDFLRKKSPRKSIFFKSDYQNIPLISPRRPWSGKERIARKNTLACLPLFILVIARNSYGKFAPGGAGDPCGESRSSIVNEHGRNRWPKEAATLSHLQPHARSRLLTVCVSSEKTHRHTGANMILNGTHRDDSTGHGEWYT